MAARRLFIGAVDGGGRGGAGRTRGWREGGGWAERRGWSSGRLAGVTMTVTVRPGRPRRRPARSRVGMTWPDGGKG